MRYLKPEIQAQIYELGDALWYISSGCIWYLLELFALHQPPLPPLT